MKIQVLAGLFLSLIVSAEALACFPKEAQVIGTVSAKRVYKVDQGITDCYYKIDHIVYFSENMMCPLTMTELQKLEVNDFDCNMNLEVGSPISGVVSVKESGHVDLE